jgi:murein DD-endopeptidase MepM/ murein hydrolase activator NlpD
MLVLAAAGAVLWHYRAELLRSLPERALLSSPHARYAAALHMRDLDDTALGRAWLAAAQEALATPADAPAEIHDTGRFEETTPGAASWRFTARRGHRITVSAEFEAGELFLDLLDTDGNTVIASATAGTTPLVHDVARDGDFLLRIQPELLRAGEYSLTQRATASLDFPVRDVSTRAVHGPFGAPRDGGRRRHEGIDIFAPRGAPAIAAVDGWITGSTTNRLGGNVVWLWAPSLGLALYYAHLDRHAVARGDRVMAGDVVGYVGTTGNARGTPPHLHFGIYARGEGAIDPAPFVVGPPPSHAIPRTAAR